ncbi:10144_t:CDS:2, partial [Paraglomus brasilianum]
QSAAGNRDMASLQKQLEALSDRIESGFRKLSHLVKASSLSSGFVTETKLGENVLKGGIEITFPLNITESTKSHSPGKFSVIPDRDASEKEIQDYFMSECSVLKYYSPIKNKLKLTVEDTRQSPVLGTRKPDFVFIQKNTDVDFLNILAIGE